MKDAPCFYFEGMSLNLGETTWSQSRGEIPDWTLHFLIDVLKEGFSIVGISVQSPETAKPLEKTYS